MPTNGDGSPKPDSMYAVDPATGDVVALARLTALDDAQRETAQILRTTLGHYVLGGQAGDDDLRERAARWCQRDADTEDDARQTAKLRLPAAR